MFLTLLLPTGTTSRGPKVLVGHSHSQNPIKPETLTASWIIRVRVRVCVWKVTTYVLAPVLPAAQRLIRMLPRIDETNWNVSDWAAHRFASYSPQVFALQLTVRRTLSLIHRFFWFSFFVGSTPLPPLPVDRRSLLPVCSDDDSIAHLMRAVCHAVPSSPVWNFATLLSLLCFEVGRLQSKDKCVVNYFPP